MSKDIPNYKNIPIGSLMFLCKEKRNIYKSIYATIALTAVKAGIDVLVIDKDIISEFPYTMLKIIVGDVIGWVIQERNDYVIQ